MSYPVISIVGPQQRLKVSFGICRPGNFWGDANLIVQRRYLLNVSFSDAIFAKAITIIIGPLYLQLGWRVR